MKTRPAILFGALLCALVVRPRTATAADYVLRSAACQATFRERDGALTLRQTGRSGVLLRSGAEGLWALRLHEGARLTAASFGTGAPDRHLAFRRAGDMLTLRYECAEAAVTVKARATAAGLELTGMVKPRRGVALELALPARLVFDANAVKRLICPSDGNQGVGMAFTRSFFLPQPQDAPTGWDRETRADAGYRLLYGAGLVMRPMDDPAIAVQVTPEGARWLGTTSLPDAASAVVNRPPAPGQADIVAVDSANGPWLSASRLGGQGTLWRIGGLVEEPQRPLVERCIPAVVNTLAVAAPAERSRVGVIALGHGPPRGGLAVVAPEEWLNLLRAMPAARQGRVRVEAIATQRELAAALRSGEWAAVINPYGEWCPVLPGADLPATLDALRGYVRAGGAWFETGGYSFYSALKPTRFFQYAGRYPALFADFAHLDSANGSAGLYRVQPLPAKPWEAASKPESLFVPGTLGCGADEQGGYLDRAYGLYVKAGQEAAAPMTRIAVGGSAESDLAAYCRANGIVRPLSAKMPAPLLDRFKRSVLVYYGGGVAEKEQYLGLLPRPALIHFADYLHGGFDKQYPDHLPPNPDFGTDRGFRAFYDHAHALGHLVMPYTNPTWWCDHPKGPTFEAQGEAPLACDLEGKPIYEKYGRNDGWTICHWHPAVRAANDRTVAQFSADYPSDVLFQDQCGARTWVYDTNPAEPNPAAYTAGLLAMVAQDSGRRPLSTESGWDRVANYESQLCGLSWALVPTEDGPSWRQLTKLTYPANTWTAYPLAQRIAHDKTAMLYHDLGQFVTNPHVVAWTLGLGFGMSDRLAASALGVPERRAWLLWLDRLQKSVCARYTGQPVGAFAHAWRGADIADDGVIHATYGPVSVTANLGPATLPDSGRVLAEYGFRASAPGMVAAYLDGAPPFVVEASGKRLDIWVYGTGGQEAVVELPAGRKAPAALVAENGRPLAVRSGRGRLRFDIPIGELRLRHFTAEGR